MCHFKDLMGAGAQREIYTETCYYLIFTSLPAEMCLVFEGEAGAKVWPESQLIFIFVSDIYAARVIMCRLSLARFPHRWANCAAGVCMEMSLWYNLWQYRHTSCSQTSPSLCICGEVG